MIYAIIFLILLIIVQHVVYLILLKELTERNTNLRLQLQNSNNTMAERLSLLRIELQKENNKIILAHSKETADLITAIFSRLK